MSNIEWTEQTWNPIVGCSRISMGCQNCYAEVMTKRLEAMGQAKYAGLLNEQGRFDGVVRFDEESLLIPLKRKKPTTYFVNSMSDLFHESIPDEWIDRVFAVMALSPQHIFQVLTKRADRMREYCRDLKHYRGALSDFWIGDAIHHLAPFITSETLRTARIDKPLPNVWLGVSVENQKAADERIPHLLDTPAAIRFLSCEPLLEEVDIRQFLEHNPVYENQRKRDICLPSGEVGRSGNFTKWRDMANPQTGLGSLAETSGEPPVQEGESGTRLRRILSSSDNDRRGEGVRAGTSACVSTFQRGNSNRQDNQSRERQEEGQPTGKFEAGNLFGTATTRDADSENGTRLRSERRKELQEQANSESSYRDSETAQGGRAVIEDSSGLSSGSQSGFQDRKGRPLGTSDLVIVGGESGPGARPCNVDWIRSIVGQCKAADVPVFVKQLGSRPVSSALSESVPFPVSVGMNWNGMGVGGYSAVLKSRKGGDPDEWPEDLRVREMPEVRR